jgi:AcrR family transcriptional regulator
LKKSDATRERILNAATAEFASYGIAGARVDRIAESAAANKNLIYVYFGSKEKLFEAVLGKHLEEAYERVPFSPEDLPGYAACSFDFLMDHPDLTRLLVWYGLEQRSNQPEQRHASFAHKLRAIAKEQRAGNLNREVPPAVLLSAITAIASAWTAINPFGSAIDPNAMKHRKALRKAIVQVVERVVKP